MSGEDLMTNYILLGAVVGVLLLGIILGRLLCWVWCKTHIKLCAGVEVKRAENDASELRRLEEGLQMSRQEKGNRENSDDKEDNKEENTNMPEPGKSNWADNIKLYMYIQKILKKEPKGNNPISEQERILI